jgi:hypothetical protein
VLVEMARRVVELRLECSLGTKTNWRDGRSRPVIRASAVTPVHSSNLMQLGYMPNSYQYDSVPWRFKDKAHKYQRCSPQMRSSS